MNRNTPPNFIIKRDGFSLRRKVVNTAAACHPRYVDPVHSLVRIALLSGILISPAVQWGRTPVDVSKLGPQVGQRVPDFELKDQNGKSWTRDSIMGSKGAMLVFYRSADW